jgi:hypothetical protein
VVPWSALESLVCPHYAKAGNGRQPVGLSIMLRTYFVQQMAQPVGSRGVEEVLYESPALKIVLMPVQAPTKLHDRFRIKTDNQRGLCFGMTPLNSQWKSEN